MVQQASDLKDEIVAEEMSISVENIGGIKRSDLTFQSGVTILKGRNATNRTSLLTAIADVLGGSAASLKTDEDTGGIELEFDETTFSREYSRQNGGFLSQGEQYTDQRELVDLFVRLLEDNPIRLAVERSEDLRELLLEPVDTHQIERELRTLEQERSEIDNQLEQIERNRKRLPSLEEKRSDLEEKQAEIAEEIDSVQDTIDTYEASEEEAEKAEQLLDELDRQRNQLQTVESNIEQQESQLEALRAEQSELEENLEEITIPGTEIDTVESELDELRREKRSIDNTIADLQQIIRFNDELVSDPDADLPGIRTQEDVTAELDPSAMTVECWTCGTEVEQGEISARLEELRKVVQEYREDRMELEAEIDDLEKRAKKLKRSANEKSKLERELERTEEEIEVRDDKREQLRDEREEIHDEIEAIEARVEETEELRESDLVDAYQELSKLEYKRGQIEQQLSKVTSDIEELEEADDDREQLRAQREEISEEIDRLRSRIEDLEESAVDQFNDHMETLLDVLGFENIARVWIERKADNTRSNTDATYELHIVRETEDGSVYEDTVDTLSESEREVIGLVVALTGYLAHEVYHTVPVMLLDSLEAIDAERLDVLIDYFAEYVPFLIVALLPEDAAALSEEYDHVTAAELQA